MPPAVEMRQWGSSGQPQGLDTGQRVCPSGAMAGSLQPLNSGLAETPRGLLSLLCVWGHPGWAQGSLLEDVQCPGQDWPSEVLPSVLSDLSSPVICGLGTMILNLILQ